MKWISYIRSNNNVIIVIIIIECNFIIYYEYVQASKWVELSCRTKQNVIQTYNEVTFLNVE